MYSPAIDAMIYDAMERFPAYQIEESVYSHDNVILYCDASLSVTLEDGVLSIGATRSVTNFSELTDEEYLKIRQVASRLYDFFGKSVEFLPKDSTRYYVMIPPNSEFDELIKIKRVAGFYSGKVEQLTIGQVKKIIPVASALFDLSRSAPREEANQQVTYKVIHRHEQARFSAEMLLALSSKTSEETKAIIKERFSYLGKVDPSQILPPTDTWEKRANCVFCRDDVKGSHCLATDGEMELWANGYPYHFGKHFMTVSTQHAASASDLLTEALLDERRIWDIARDVMQGPSFWIQRGPAGGQTVPHYHAHLVEADECQLAELLVANLVEVYGQPLKRLTKEEMQSQYSRWEKYLQKKAA